MKAYADLGGRVFASHWHNVWIGGAYDRAATSRRPRCGTTIATWNAGTNLDTGTRRSRSTKCSNPKGNVVRGLDAQRRHGLDACATRSRSSDITGRNTLQRDRRHARPSAGSYVDRAAPTSRRTSSSRRRNEVAGRPALRQGRVLRHARVRWPVANQSYPSCASGGMITAADAAGEGARLHVLRPGVLRRWDDWLRPSRVEACASRPSSSAAFLSSRPRRRAAGVRVVALGAPPLELRIPDDLPEVEHSPNKIRFDGPAGSVIAGLGPAGELIDLRALRELAAKAASRPNTRVLEQALVEINGRPALKLVTSIEGNVRALQYRCLIDSDHEAWITYVLPMARFDVLRGELEKIESATNRFANADHARGITREGKSVFRASRFLRTGGLSAATASSSSCRIRRAQTRST